MTDGLQILLFISQSLSRPLTFVRVLLSSAPPITFKVKLRSQQVEEDNSVTMSCELSKPGLTVEWKKGGEVLKNGLKYQIKKREAVAELAIKKALLEDSGLYSCVYNDLQTTASITVTRKYGQCWEKYSHSLLKYVTKILFRKICGLKLLSVNLMSSFIHIFASQ